MMAHERTRKEWGLSAQLRMESKADGQGPSFSLRLSQGRTGSGLRRLFNDSSLSAGTDAQSPARLEAELGRGFRVAGNGPSALVTPYAGFSLPESGGQTLRLGTRYRLGEELNIGVEAATRPGVTAVDSIQLQVGLYW